MYILTMIRKNLPGKPDYIMTAQYADNGTIIFAYEQEARQYFDNHFRTSDSFAVYAPKIIYVPQ